MDVILFPVSWQFVLVYFNDVVASLRLPRDHIDQVKQVTPLLRGVKVTLKSRNRSFFTENIDCHSYLVHPRQSEIATHKMVAIKELKPLRNITELRSFLRLCNLFRRIVPIIAQIATSLNNKVKKNQLKDFGDLTFEKLRAMHESQEKLVFPPIFTIPNTQGWYTADTNSCSVRVRCVLVK